MDCDAAKPLLSVYLDGELGAGESLALETHLEGCADCREVLARAEAASAAIRGQAEYFRSPGPLRARILDQLQASLPAAPPVRAAARWRVFGIGSLAASAAALAASLLLFINAPGPANLIADQIVASHVRSMMAQHLTDVASSDQHTVKPWFDGKLDLAPPVVDLAKAGFPLVGGRLDYIDHRPVAALVYRHDKHLINLFVMPATGAATAATDVTLIRGYEVLRWSAGGMDFWAVSDLNPGELKAWHEALTAALPPLPAAN